MPIEIRELVIRAVVDEGKTEDTEDSLYAADYQEKLLTECADQVLKILERSKER